MRVLVPAVDGADCPAHLALVAEGVEHEVRVCAGDLGYGEWITAVWQAGEGFVIVEHDVAPWVGAVAQLEVCERDWCMFRYMKHGGSLTRGLGCAKFSDRIVREYPDLPAAWRGVGWQVLDGSVGAAVGLVLRAEEPERFPLCFHEPSVAHVRRLED